MKFTSTDTAIPGQKLYYNIVSLNLSTSSIDPGTITDILQSQFIGEPPVTDYWDTAAHATPK